MTNQFDRAASPDAQGRATGRFSRVITGPWGRRPDRSPSNRASSDRASSSNASALVIIPGVAVLYAVLGFIALGFARTTGLASPVWPAAGLAFAAALQWRWRALPGIFAGSVGVNLLWLSRLGEPGSRIWFATVAIGVGAVLGAGAGAILVHRFAGPVRRLDTPRTVLLTLGLGGLLATAIAPTVGVAAQVATGLVSADKAAFGWLTWWVGDAIGVIVFGPLVLMLLPSRNEYWTGRRWTVAIPSLLIVGLLMAAILQNLASERNRIADAVQKLGDQAITDLAGSIARHQEILEGVRGLVDASETVTAQEFNVYTSGVLARFPNLQALSWNPLITRADLAAFQAREREQPGLTDFTVNQRGPDGNLEPVSPRPEYVVVAYIEPIAENRNALGYDIYSNPLRAAAIEIARDTGRPTATAPIDLVQESGTQKGMLALLPVYEGGADPGNLQARRAGLRGFAVGVYRLGDLLTETFNGAGWDSTDITLVDVSDGENPVVIADLPARNPGAYDRVSATPTATTFPLDVYGRSWELTVHPTSESFIDGRNGTMAILLLAVLAVAFMLEAFLLFFSGMEGLARRLTSELSGAARYVASILPEDSDGPVPVTARHIPSEELGGDSFDHRWVDDDHLIAYLVDVVGHGIPPAMFSVSVHNLLRSGTLDDDTLCDPGKVLTELNRLFQMDQQAGNYFTIFYCVYRPSTRTLRYARAGHPPAIVLPTDGSEPVLLQEGSMPIGVIKDITYDTYECPLNSDADVMIYSDGAYELILPGGRHWVLEEFIDLCANTARSPQGEVARTETGWTLDDLVEQLKERAAAGQFDDDCTLVRITVR